MSEKHEPGQGARSVQAGAAVGAGVAAAYLIMAGLRLEYPDVHEQLTQVERDMALAFCIFVAGRVWSFIGDVVGAVVQRIRGQK